MPNPETNHNHETHCHKGGTDNKAFMGLLSAAADTAMELARKEVVTGGAPPRAAATEGSGSAIKAIADAVAREAAREAGSGKLEIPPLDFGRGSGQRQGRGPADLPAGPRFRPVPGGPRGSRPPEKPSSDEPPEVPENGEKPEEPDDEKSPVSTAADLRKPGDHEGDSRYHDKKAYNNMPAPADRGPYTKDGVYLDPRLESLNVELEPADVKPGEKYWKVTGVEYQSNTQFTEGINESGDRLNIYFAAKDENGNPIPGAVAVQEWPDGKARSGTDGGGGTNFPMGRGSSFFPEDGHKGGYKTSMEGYPSEKVSGLGMPGGAHVSYVVTYQLVTKK